MESILKVQVAEAILFEAGSGTGTNRSPLRSSKKRSLVADASGPVSFMKGYDAYANIVQGLGGKTRRAAKMEILQCRSPRCHGLRSHQKQDEEKKA